MNFIQSLVIRQLHAELIESLRLSIYASKMDNQLKLLPQISGKPSPDWLNFVVTSKARSSIRLALRNQKDFMIKKSWQTYAGE